MTSPSFPMECLENIPGFKAILKAVIKSQILALVNQLADQTGEQVVILTADVSQQTFTQFGSSDSTDFLTERDDVHTDFLKHCIKKFNLRHHTSTSKDVLEEESNDIEKETSINSPKHKRRHRAQTEVSTETKATKRKSAAEVGSGDALHHVTVDRTVLTEGEPSHKTKRRFRDKTGKQDDTNSIDNVEDGCGTMKMETNSAKSDINETRNSMSSAANSESQESVHRTKGSDEYDRDIISVANSLEPDQRPGKPASDQAPNSLPIGLKDQLDRDTSNINDDDMDNDTIEDEYDNELSGVLNKDRVSDDSVTAATGDKVLKVTKTGRRFVSGQALNDDLRTSLVLQVVEQGGDVKTGYVPRGVFTQVGKQLGVNTSSVSRIWERYVNDGTITPRQTTSKK